MKDIEKYIYEIYHTGSFSKAANNLFISQPALSNSVKRYEKQLGYEIFDRKTVPLSVTRKGMIYIEYLEEKIALYKQLKEDIKRVDYDANKKIRIGSNNSSAIFTFPFLCREFSKIFPEVNIEISVASNSKILNENIENGSLDIVLDSKNTYLNSEKLKLWEEKYVFLIRKDYPGIETLAESSLSFEEIYSGVFPEKKKVRDWSSLCGINIFMPSKNPKMMDSINNYFKDIITRRILFKVFYRLDMQYSMMENGLGALICPQSLVISKGYDEKKYCCFSIDIPDNKREMYLYYNKNNPLEYAREFIKIAKKMYGKMHFFPKNIED